LQAFFKRFRNIKAAAAKQQKNNSQNGGIFIQKLKKPLSKLDRGGI
jgi:hypothetical protein